MNYGTDRSEVICRTYVRKTLISEKVAYNLEDAKQVLDCAESLHPCRRAGRAKDFTYDVLTKKLEQQISHSDGLVFSVTCKGAVKQQDYFPASYRRRVRVDGDNGRRGACLGQQEAREAGQSGIPETVIADPKSGCEPTRAKTRSAAVPPRTLWASRASPLDPSRAVFSEDDRVNREG
ncbi:hypothetical protein MRX96_033492 [Rhipicephalus microplus]